MSTTLKNSVVGISLALISTVACAATFGPSTINDVGCNSSNICYADLTLAFPLPTCANTQQFAWDGSTSVGKNWFAVLLAAKLSGKRVAGDVTLCLANTASPTFNYVHVLD